MLKFISVVSLAFLSLNTSAQDRYTIKGHLSKVKTGKVFLMAADYKTPIDSALLKDGYFTFKGIADHNFLQKGYFGGKNLPVKSALVAKPFKKKNLSKRQSGEGYDFQDFYLEKGLNEVSGTNMNAAMIKSGKVQEEYRALKSIVQVLEEKQKLEIQASEQGVKKDSVSQKEGLRKYYEINGKWADKISEEKLKFVDQHPKSMVSLDIVSEFAVVINPVEFEPLFNKLAPVVQQSPKGKYLAARLKIAKKTAVGQPAMDFTVNDTLGNPVSLSSLRGKYVLIDFWSSGCFPCRMETPNVLKAYKKFKDKNFEVISISLDTDKKLWMNAIHKDGMPWINVSDLKGWESAVAVQYGIRAIPQTFLVDPKGIIIATNLRGEGLYNELQKLTEPKGDPFTLRGEFLNKWNGKVYTLYYEDGQAVSDSVPVKDGIFAVNGKVSSPTEGRILTSIDGKLKLRTFYIDQGEINMKGDDFITAKITGGKTQSEYLTFTEASKLFGEQQNALMEKMQKVQKGSAEEQAIKDSMSKNIEEYKKTRIAFIKRYPESFVSLDMIAQEADDLDPAIFEQLFNTLDMKLRESERGKSLASRLEFSKKLMIGKPILPFVQNDTAGKPFALSSLLGKYVLIDFWASWCGPCRQENPNVVKAYEAFKNKNFQIVSISLDDKKENWLNAIHKDGMPWIHLSDLKGWKNEVAVQYGVQGIPQNFLIDPKGTIVATNLRGEDLMKELQKLIVN